MTENRLMKQVKKLYAYLNDHRKPVSYKIIEREKYDTFRFCSSINLDMLESKKYLIFLDLNEVNDLFKIDHYEAIKILYEKFCYLLDKRERKELYVS